MNKWVFFSIVVVCATAVNVIDRFFPSYEECGCD